MRVAQEVERILVSSRMARNSDRHLMLEYMESKGVDFTPSQKELFLHLASMETVSRVRRKLQEKGKYVADQKVKRERDFKSMRMQQVAPKAKAEYIGNILEGPDNTPKAISWLNDD